MITPEQEKEIEELMYDFAGVKGNEQPSAGLVGSLRPKSADGFAESNDHDSDHCTHASDSFSVEQTALMRENLSLVRRLCALQVEIGRAIQRLDQHDYLVARRILAHAL